MAHPGVISLEDIAARRIGLTAGHIGNNLVMIAPGFFLGRTDMALENGISYGAETFPFAAMSILLEGRISPHGAGMEELLPDATVAIANNERRELRSTFHGAERLRNVEVFVTPEWFETSRHASADADFDHVREAMLRPMRGKQNILDQRLRGVAEMVLAAQGTGALAALRLEAWSLDLLAELVSSFRAPQKQIPLSSTDRERIHSVRQQLEAAPEASCSISELARQYGVSASKLKRDFFIAFETCVGSFANTQRLVLGKKLLEEGISVSQVAYRVGYSHPANFSAAFKRHFGVSPRDIRR